MASILGTVIATPVTRMTKGNDKKPAAPVANFSVFEKVQGADKKLVDGGRVIEIGVFNPKDLSKVMKGSLVRISTQGVKSSPWKLADGREGMNHKATTNGAGVVVLAAMKAA